MADHNEQVVDLIRDQFKQVNANILDLSTTVKEHIKKDEKAWDRIMDVENEIKVTKRVGLAVGSAAATVAAYLGFGK